MINTALVQSQFEYAQENILLFSNNCQCQCMDKVSITSNQSKFHMRGRHFTHDGIMEVVEVYIPVNVCATVWASFLLMFRLLCYYRIVRPWVGHLSAS